jgi:hypothetical protein
MFDAFIGCVLLALGTVVLGTFAEDFQEQAFEEFQFLFAEQQGKCPLTILHLCPFSLVCRRRTT